MRRSPTTSVCNQSKRLHATRTFQRVRRVAHQGPPARMLRPCKSVCQEMIRSCDVDCCDESVQCMFNHTVVSLLEGETVTAAWLCGRRCAICDLHRKCSEAFRVTIPHSCSSWDFLFLVPLSSGVMQVVQGFGRRGLLSPFVARGGHFAARLFQ